MDNKKDIGKAFKEQLRDFKKSPNNLIWNDIETALDKEEDSKGFYWLQLTSITALLITLTIIGVYTFKDSTNINKPQNIDSITHQEQSEKCDEIITNNQKETFTNIDKIADSEKEIKDTTKLNTVKSDSYKTQEKKLNTSQENRSTNYKLANNVDSKNDKKIATIDDNPTSAKNKVSKTKDLEIKNKTTEIFKHKTSNDTTISGKLKHIVISDSIEKIKNDTLLITTIDQKEKNLKKPSKDTLIFLNPIKNKIFDKLNFGVHITPTYTFPMNGSLISDRLSNIKEKGSFTLNYGAVLTGYVNDKVSIRAGYNNIKISSKVNDIVSDELSSVLSDADILVPNTIIQSITNQETVDLTQKLHYHELSLELGYRIIDKRFSWSVLGGMGFLIAQKNNITIHSGSNDFGLGMSDAIESTNTSINFGSNLRYRLLKNIYFNVEPLVKYQLSNASKNSGSYKPLYFTIQTGLSIDF
ncbi:hypothetical protein [uncultured Aquimarina sp.]|uniref:hypothetical protein n=1 Tax=uncultured Aquimarina sp. TaxID=575652 RepID=UPI002623ABC5|nr:hypothetical protein [uncultured Aquimarina sp.]